MSKQIAWKEIDRQSDRICKASDRIWDYAETAFKEEKSAKVLMDILEEEGFILEKNLADIPTAFRGTYGSGKPVVGILGEFDALSGLNQEAGIAEKREVVPGAAGHGCGHNLLGCGSLAAAMGIKKYLEETHSSGTVIYYGCPGEEGGSGKAFMAKEGVFRNLDIALTWHPYDVTYACTSGRLANYQVAYKFYGVSAHAGSIPHLGRSALDAVELMNVGVQFLREHMIPEARIHYAITNTGGHSPNVVQNYSEVLYLIRAPKNSQVEELYQRVNKIAEGAALMTETRVEIDFVKGCSNLISNKVIAKALWENLNEIGVPEYTKEEMEYARKIYDSADGNTLGTLKTALGNCDTETKHKIIAEHQAEPIHSFVTPFDEVGSLLTSSTDVGDVSWNCPTAQTYIATWAAGTPGHSWQAVAQGKSEMAHKGMIYAAKAVAGAAIDLMENPELISKAKEEFLEDLEGETYTSPIPDGCRPRTLS